MTEPASPSDGNAPSAGSGTGVASFHLVRLPPGRQPLALARLGLDRLWMRRVDGLVFWRLLGTGAGSDTGPGADLRRTALFAVWRNEAALAAFEASMAERRTAAEEYYSVRLLGLGGHGTWRGFDVIAALRSGQRNGPVAMITRADVRLRSWRAFANAGPAVSARLQQAPGLLAVCGIGEAPIGRQATFSLWVDARSARQFAYATDEHRRVIERTRDENWYGEEMFASFQPYDSTGTWDGIDPLVSG
jgi:hypothetical protein